MAFPVLENELVLLLRRPFLFFSLGVVFVSLTIGAFISSQGLFLSLERDLICRRLFYFILGLAYLGFSFHASRVAAGSTSKERDRNTSVFLRVAPLGSWSIVFQKAAMSLSIEWLIFSGLLPFLSLLFLVGGVSGREFCYHLASLAMWTSTCVMIGLVVGIRGRNTAIADRTALSTVLCLALAPAGLIYLCGKAQTYLQLLPFWDRLQEGFDTFLHLLLCLSPLWMVGSWHSEGPPFPFIRIEILSGFLPNPQCPALLSWILHLCLQLLLLVLAVYLWKRAELGLVGEGRVEHSVRGYLHKVPKVGAIKRKYGEGWTIFQRHESRQMIKRPVVSTILLLCILIVSATWGSISAGKELPVVTAGFGFLAIVLTLFVSQSAYAREIRRGTAPLLFASPVSIRQVVLGKWIFYQSLGLRILLPGIVFTLGMFGARQFSGSANIHEIWIHLSIYLLILASLPFASIVGILFGLSVFPMYVLVPGALAVVCFFPFSALFFLGWVFHQLIVRGGTEEEHVKFPTAKLERTYGTIAILAICAVLFGLVLGGALANTGLEGATFLTLLLLNFAVLPPAVGIAIYHWLCGQPEAWWKEKILVFESPGIASSQYLPKSRREVERHARYRAHILNLVATHRVSRKSPPEPH